MEKNTHSKPKKISLNQIILLIVFVAFIWIFVSRFKEILEIINTLLQGKWLFICIAVIFILIYYYSFTLLYYYSFVLVGVKSKVMSLFPLMFASVFANLVPTGGTGGAALFIHDAALRKESVAKTAIGTLLVQLFDFTSFLFVLGFGIAYLLTKHDLKTYQVIASSILILAIGIIITLLMISLWQIRLIKKLLKFFQKIINRISNIIRHKDTLSYDWSEKAGNDFQNAALAIAYNPKLVLKIIGIALLTHVFELIALYFLFIAFSQEIWLGVLVTGYSMTHLFTTITITPQGIGMVEGIMTLIFTSLGIHAEKAAVITLVFRGMNLWLPLFIGFLLLRKLRFFNQKED